MKFVFISHGIPNLATQRISEIAGKKPQDIEVLYITTPANTYPPTSPWIVEAKQDILNQGFQMTELDISKEIPEQINRLIIESDIVWVSGGNCFYFLYWAQKVGLKKMLVDFLNRGGIYAGESAGAVCQIRDLEPIKWLDNPDLAPEIINEGLQLTDVVVVPHWNTPKYQEKLDNVKQYYEEKGVSPYLLSDGEAIIIDGEKIELINK